MCRPPDPSVQFPSSERRSRDLASQLYGQTGVELSGDVYRGSAGDWEEDVGEDYPLQEEGGWDWPQQMIPANASFLQNSQTAIPGNNTFLSAAGTEVHRLPKQQRIVPLDRHLNFSNTTVPQSQQSFPSSEQVPWKLQQLLQGGRPNPPLTSWGGSLPMAPPRAATNLNMPPDQITSVMAGPSMGSGAPAGFMTDSQLAGPRSSAPTMWAKQKEEAEKLERWLKGSVTGIGSQFAGRQGQSMVLEGSEALTQLQALGMAPNSMDVSSQEKQYGPGELADPAEDDGTEDDEVVKEKKIRRMLSNRASAKRSRQRRQERLGELEIQTAKLRVENAAITRKLNEAMEQVQRYQHENGGLRDELEHLRAEMRSLKHLKPCSTIPGEQESGKASAQSAATAAVLQKEEVNEAHSEEKWATGEEKPDCKNWKLVNLTKSGTDCSPDIKPTNLVAGNKPKEAVCAVKHADAEEDSPNNFVRKTVTSMEGEPNGVHQKALASSASGLTTGSDRSLPGFAGVESVPICELDALGLPVLDTAMLEPDVLDKDMELANDEWFESLVQCLD